MSPEEKAKPVREKSIFYIPPSDRFRAWKESRQNRRPNDDLVQAVIVLWIVFISFALFAALYAWIALLSGWPK